MNDVINDLKTKIQHFTQLDTDSLDKSDELREGFDFEAIRNRSNFIISTLQHIDLGNLQYIETENAQEIIRILDQIIKCYREIEKLNILSGDLPQLRTLIEERFNVAFWEFQKSIRLHLFIYSKYNCIDDTVIEYFLNPSNLKLKIERTNNELDRSRKEIGKTQEEARKFATSFNSAKKSLRDELENFKASTSERLKLNSVAVLWSQREESYQKWHFRFSVILLTIFLVFVATIVASLTFDTINIISRLLTPHTEGAVTNWPEFLSYTLPRFIIFGLPVAGAIWFIRILLRLYLTNLAMLEDAKQRKTILDTYFSLIENDPDAAKERHLLLNAMFRQLPGEPNDIEPPNLSELMSLGKGK